MAIMIEEKKVATTEERWLSVYLYKTETSGSPESTVSCKCEFLEIIGPLPLSPLQEITKITMPEETYYVWPKVMNKVFIDSLTNNTRLSILSSAL